MSLSTLCELIGAASVAVGAALIASWLAWIVGGLTLIAVGYALDR